MSSDQLADQRVFHGVPKEKLEDMFDSGSVVTRSNGEIVVEEGEDPDNIYFILSGEVDVLITDAEDSGSEKRVNTLVAGECIGEYGFVDGRPTCATVRAITDTKLFELPIAVLRQKITNDADLQRTVYENLLDSLVERLRTNNIIIEFLRHQD